MLNGASYQNPGKWQDASGSSMVGIVVEYEPPAVSFNPANGHYYEFVSLERNWSQARADAEARVLTNGWRGHLVTIQDAPENAFVTALVSNVAAVWIGGYQPGGSAEPAGGWRWSTSEALAFTNWAPGEPSDFGFGVNSDSILLNAVNVANAGQWRAASGNLPSPQFYPYLVEYEPAMPNAFPDLSVSQTFSPNFLALGQNVTIVVTVTNRGGSATGVALMNTLPMGFGFVSAMSTSGACTFANGVLACSIGTLAGGSAAVVTVVATASASGLVENRAMVALNEQDSNGSDNFGSLYLSVQSSSDRTLNLISLPGSRQFVVTWPLSETFYALESCTNLASGSWLAISQGSISVYTNGSILYRSLTNDMSLPSQFYRLRYSP